MSLLSASSVKAPDISREFRGVWVATVDNIDWPSKPGLPVQQQKAEMLAILDKCKALRMNAVVFQVRPAADALYKSKYEPWSWYLTGQQGMAPSGGFDPLAFTVAEAHKRGLELHAWCNPYRAYHPSQTGPVTEDHISVTHPAVVKKYGTLLWMDPGEKAVQDRSFNVFMDLVEHYDLDGLHIDDYFYPYPVKENGKDVDFPDSPSYQAYLSRGGTLNRGDWRRKCVDDFIQRVYTGIKARKKNVKFGISPFGIYRPGVPEGIKAGIDQYDALYADCHKWLVKGWCDYMSPQLYWPIAQTPQSFPVLLKWWNQENVMGRHMWPGQFTSRTDPKSGNWNAKEVTDQIRVVRDSKKATGTVHFSMKAVMKDYNGIATALGKAYGKPALVPASPWLGSTVPAAPHAKVAGSLVKVTSRAPSGFRFYVYQFESGRTVVTSSAQVQLTGTDKGLCWVSVQDVYGNLGKAATVKLGS